MACKVPVHARRPADATQGGEEETKHFFTINITTTVVVFVVVLLVCFIRVRIINYYLCIIIVSNCCWCNYCCEQFFFQIQCLTPERKKMIKLLGRVSPTVPVLLLPITYSDLEADDETFLAPPLAMGCLQL